MERSWSPTLFLQVSRAAGVTTARVTVRNTGDTTWTRDGSYALGAVNPEDVLLTAGDRVDLGPAVAVAPGSEYTFDLVLSAPGAGAYTTEWRMVRGGVRWFGDSATSTVSVVCDGPFRVFPAVIDGRFDMPEHVQRVASRDASLVRLGHVITGNDDIDNAVLGAAVPTAGSGSVGAFTSRSTPSARTLRPRGSACSVTSTTR
jgi:hypothetical protein